MTILITGGAGFIGGHTVLAFIAKFLLCWMIYRLATGRQFRQAFPSLPATSEIRS